MDPESFVRGDQTLTFLVDEGREKYHLKQAIKPFKWSFIVEPIMPNIDAWLGSFVMFQGIRTNIAKEPYMIF